MEQPVTTPTPAPETTPQTLSAAEAAVSKSPREYRAAKRAERAGSPLPPVDVPAVSAQPTPTPAPVPPPEPKKYTLTQDELNDRTRRAVEQALADFKATQTPPPASVPPAPPAAPVEKFPDIQEWAAKPENADKTLSDYLEARDEHRERQRAEAAKVEQSFKDRAEALTQQTTRFANAMGEALKAEPDLADKIPPAMRDPQASVPLSAMSAEQLKTAKFSNLVAEAAFRSAQPAELLKYLHTHQAETIRLAQIERQYGTVAALGALAALDGQIGHAKAAAPAPAAATSKPKTLTDAPAPIDTLGSRPAEVTDPTTAAVKRGDTRAYRELRRQERAAKLLGRR